MHRQGRGAVVGRRCFASKERERRGDSRYSSLPSSFSFGVDDIALLRATGGLESSTGVFINSFVLFKESGISIKSGEEGCR